MGREKPSSAKAHYYGIVDGSFFESYNVTESTPDAEMIIVTNPQTKESKEKWVVKYKALTGYVTAIAWSYVEAIKSDQLVIDMYDPDDQEKSIIKLGLNTGYARDFIKRLPNADLTKEVKLTSYQAKRDDDPTKYNTGVSIRNRDGLDWSKDPIALYWTKATPQNAPQLTDDGISGDFDIWKIKFSKYLKAYLEKEVPGKIVSEPWLLGKPADAYVPPANEGITGSTPNSGAKPSTTPNLPDNDPEDDLPF